MSTDNRSNPQNDRVMEVPFSYGNPPPKESKPEIQPRPQPAPPANSGQGSGQKQDK
jgi:hypothetical protein